MSFARVQLSKAIRAKNLTLVNEILSKVINITDVLNEKFEDKTPIYEALEYWDIKNNKNDEIFEAIGNKIREVDLYKQRGAGSTLTRKNKRRGARRSTRLRKYKNRKNK